jgi:hypothetical protein
MLRKYKSVVAVLDMKVVTILTEITTKLESFLPKKKKLKKMTSTPTKQTEPKLF